MRITKLLLPIVIVFCTSALATPPPAGPGDDELYRRGSAAIDAKNWNEAIDAFRAMAAKGGPNGDRAWYWLAYAQKRAGRPGDALASLGQLEQNYPDSKWTDDAEALEIEVRQSLGQQVAPESLDDDELKVLAITSLMHSDPERAMTLLEKVLVSPKSSEEVKEQSLFVLSQSSSPRARPLLESAARGKMGTDVQISALEMLGVSRRKENRALLLEVMQKTTDPKVKEAAMDGLMVSGDHESLFAIAKSNPDPDVRSDAAELLGAMKATNELDQLFKSEKNGDVRESIIDGMFVAGNVEWIATLAKSDADPKMRAAAIEMLGPVGSRKTGDLLIQLWKSVTTRDEKEAVLDALFVQGNAKALIGLAKSEPDRKLRREIVERIAMLKDPEAQVYMMQFLED